MIYKAIIKKIINKNSVPVFLLLFLAVITHIEWFNIGSNLFFHDWKYRNDIAVSQIVNFARATWINFYGLGEQNIQIYTFLPTYIWGLIGDYAIATKITYFWPIAFLSLLAPYFLFKKIIGNNIVSFFAALFYGFSSYLIMRTTSHLPIAFVYSLTPIILLCFIRFYLDASWKNLIIFSLVYSIGCYYELRLMYIVSWIVVLYFIVFFKLELIKKNFSKYLLFGLLILLLNFFWILPTMLGSKDLIEKTANRGIFGNQLFSIVESMAFFDWKWTGEKPMQEFSKQPIAFYFWLFPIIAIFAFWSFRKQSKENKKYIVFFSILLVLGLLLTKQTGQPFGSVYEWLYNNFPGFNLYRVASHFYVLLACGYCGIFAFGLKSILENTKRNTGIIIVFFLSFSIIFTISPLINKKIGSTYINKQKPTEYIEFENKILSDNKFFRTLWMPVASPWTPYDTNHPKISMWTDLLTNLQNNFSELSVVSNELSNFTNSKLYSHFFSTSYGNLLLDIMNVRYIAVPFMPDEFLGRDLFPYAGKYEDYIEELDKLKYLSKEKIGKLVYFENKNYREHIYSFNDLILLDSLEDLESKNNFLVKIGKKLLFSLQPIPNLDIFTVHDTSMETNEKDGEISIINNDFDNTSKKLYINTSELYYRRETNKIKISIRFDQNIKIDNINKSKIEEKEVIDVDVEDNKKYYLEINNKLVGLNDEQGTLGILSNDSVINLYSISESIENIIPNGSFENGFWNPIVGDCNKYDDKGDLSMSLNVNDKTDGNNSLQLGAVNHIACVSKIFQPRESRNFLFKFDYKGINSKTAGFHIQLDDINKTVFQDKVSIVDGSWNEYLNVVSIPSGVHNAKLHLYSYSTDGATNNIILYDNIKFQELFLEININLKDVVNDYYIINV